MACCVACAQSNNAKPRGLGFLSTGSFEDDGGGYDPYSDANFTDWFYDPYSDPNFTDGYQSDTGFYGYNSYDEFADAFWGTFGYSPEEAGIENPYAYETAAEINTEEESAANRTYDFGDWGWFGDFAPAYVPEDLDGSSGAPWETPTNASRLPGVCPPGFYHPMSDPYSCVPFPPRQPQKPQQRPQQKPQPKPQQKPQPQPCPPGMTRALLTGKCQCPARSKWNAQTQRCERETTPATPLVNRTLPNGQPKQAMPWWVLLIGAGVAYKLVSDDGGSRRRRR